MTKLKLAMMTVLVAALVAAAFATLPRGYEAGRLLAAKDDPSELADVVLDARFDAAAAMREIDLALADGDPELAASFVELASERGIALDPGLLSKVSAAEQDSHSARSTAWSFVRGLVTGQPDSVAGFAGTAFGDLFVFGDVRDAVREGVHAVRGREVDGVVLGLSLAGIAITAGTYASFGAAAPARLGLSVIKAAGKTERLGAGFVRMVRLEKTEGLVRVAGDLGRVQAKAGTRAAIEGLKLVEGPKDAERLAQLATRQGTKTRAIIKLLGRAALVLSSAVLDLASWVVWAILNLLGLCAALKRATERTTLFIIHRANARRAARLALALHPLAP